jgi:hypothetical protein
MPTVRRQPSGARRKPKPIIALPVSTVATAAMFALKRTKLPGPAAGCLVTPETSSVPSRLAPKTLPKLSRL